MLQSRIQRYQEFIENTYFDLFSMSDEYAFVEITPQLRERLEAQVIQDIYFVGVGGSAVVAHALRGFFRSIAHHVHIEVINDFSIDDFLRPDRPPAGLGRFLGWRGCRRVFVGHLAAHRRHLPAKPLDLALQRAKLTSLRLASCRRFACAPR